MTLEFPPLDDPDEVQLATGVVRDDGLIELLIDPRMKPSDAIVFYRWFRRQALGGRRYRRMTPKHRRLAEFARDRSVTWLELLGAWNREPALENPDWWYGPDQVEQFARDCREARKKLGRKIGVTP